VASHGLGAHAVPLTPCASAQSPWIERRSPALAVVASKLHVVALPRHAGDDVADTGPRVEPAVKQAQLRLAGFQREEAESGAEKPGALIEHGESLVVHRGAETEIREDDERRDTDRARNSRDSLTRLCNELPGTFT
jgi:hypothetical protein